MSIENIEKLIADHRVEFVDLRFSDMRCVQHHVTFPKSIIEPTLFEVGKMFDGTSLSGWRGIHQPDMVLLHDPVPSFPAPVTPLTSEDRRRRIARRCTCTKRW